MTVQNIIDAIQEYGSSKTGPDTVDTLKCGDPAGEVKGIVVCFMATFAVLRKAVDLGANLVITHEPTFYNHRDETDWLSGDVVGETKLKWVRDQGLAIWRFHDGPHRLKPDGIDVGMARKLDWVADAAGDKVFRVPMQSAKELAESCKQRLGISRVRVAGDLQAPCSRVGLRVGASGGRSQIELFRDRSVDVVVCGESPEWETCEYVRDAAGMGQAKALIVLGHANSEEAGMEWLAVEMQSFLPAHIPLHYVPAGDPFTFV